MEINVKFIEELDKKVSDCMSDLIETENRKYEELHGKKYKGLTFQYYKRKDVEHRLRIYAGDNYPKRYYSTKRYTPIKEIFKLCDSIINGER